MPRLPVTFQELLEAQIIKERLKYGVPLSMNVKFMEQPWTTLLTIY